MPGQVLRYYNGLKLDNFFFSLFSNLCNICTSDVENITPIPKPSTPKKRKEEETIYFFSSVSPLINFISNKKIKSMVKGKHDFFTNQFLPFALAVEL